MFATPHSVTVHRYTLGDADAHGNPVESWVPDATATPVHAVAPGASLDAIQSGRDVSEVLWTVYAPAGTAVGPRDRIAWLGEVYHVNGEPRDFTHGPWVNPAAGVVIELRRTEG